jgi:hypothetical protein
MLQEGLFIATNKFVGDLPLAVTLMIAKMMIINPPNVYINKNGWKS